MRIVKHHRKENYFASVGKYVLNDNDDVSSCIHYENIFDNLTWKKGKIHLLSSLNSNLKLAEWFCKEMPKYQQNYQIHSAGFKCKNCEVGEDGYMNGCARAETLDSSFNFVEVIQTVECPKGYVRLESNKYLSFFTIKGIFLGYNGDIASCIPFSEIFANITSAKGTIFPVDSLRKDTDFTKWFCSEVPNYYQNYEITMKGIICDDCVADKKGYARCTQKKKSEGKKKDNFMGRITIIVVVSNIAVKIIVGMVIFVTRRRN